LSWGLNRRCEDQLIAAALPEQPCLCSDNRLFKSMKVADVKTLILMEPSP
jgi:hypothetical protein